MFWVISVYFNIRNTLPKSGTFLLGHPVYIGYIYIYIHIYTLYCFFHTYVSRGRVTHSMPCTCRSRAMPCRYGFRMCLSHLIYTVRPCLIHTCHAMPMPCPCHVLTMPFFSRPRHSTAVQRRPVGYLPTISFFRLPRGFTRRLLSEAYQSSSQRSIPTIVKSGSSTLQKRRYVKLLD